MFVVELSTITKIFFICSIIIGHDFHSHSFSVPAALITKNVTEMSTVEQSKSPEAEKIIKSA